MAPGLARAHPRSGYRRWPKPYGYPQTTHGPPLSVGICALGPDPTPRRGLVSCSSEPENPRARALRSGVSLCTQPRGCSRLGRGVTTVSESGSLSVTDDPPLVITRAIEWEMR